MKKILLLFTALLLSATAMAYDFKVDGLCYSILDEYSVEVTPEAGFNNNYPDLVKAVIPNYVEYDNVQYRVLGLGENAFNCAKNLESIEFTSGGYEFYIKSFAAANCPKLKNVDLVGVSEIGDFSFAAAALESIRIWWGIEKIGNQIFMGCKNLTEIKVDENNKYYDSRDNCNAIVETKTNTLIMGCNASTIPNTVTTIARYAFQDCENLAIEHLPTSVVKVGANAFDGTPLCPYASTPREGAFYIDHILYRYYTSNPETATTLTVKEGTLGIAEYACAGNKFSSLTLPTSLKCIESGAFTDAQLSQLSLPASVEYIGDYAFSNNLLTNITIPENVKYIGAVAFSPNLLTSITWNAIDCETSEWAGGNIASPVFGNDASYYSLKSFTFGNNVKTIPNSLCDGLGFNVEEGIEITLPNSLEKIGHRAFAASGIKTITIPENVKSIGNDVFDFCLKLTSATWNAKNCTRISQTNEYNDEIISAVFGTTHYLEEGAEEATILGVKSITFGSGVTNIPQFLCQYNDLITSVTLPSSVKSIENYAFGSCYNLSQVTLGGNEESIHPEAFRDTPWWNSYYENLSDGPIYLGKSLVGYNGEMPENTTLVVKEGTLAIADNLFIFENRPDNLVAVIFPESLKEIGENAFLECSSLKEITIPKNVTKIGEYAFNADYLEKVTWNAINCESTYKEIIYGDEVSVENRFIFYADSKYGEGSSTIKTFIFGNEVESIPYALCFGMSEITEITIPNSVKSIGKSAFKGCSISEITIPEGVSYVGGGAFSGGKRLSKVVWNAIDCKVDENRKVGDITYLSESIFGYSEILTSFTFGNKVKTIPSGLCRDLPLQSISIPESVETIEEFALRLGSRSITEIYIPAGVKLIEEDGIGGYSIEKFIVDKNNAVYASQDGILYTKDFTKILEVPSNLKGEINIPAVTENVLEHKGMWTENPLTAINIAEGHETLSSIDGVLFNKDKTILYHYPNLKEGEKYIVPSTVATIDTMAFANMYLNELEMSDNVTRIEFAAFYSMPVLEKIQLSNSIKEIPHYAFMNSDALETIVIPEGVESIGVGAFMGCDNLSMAVIPSTVKKIGTEAFVMQETNLRNVYCYATTPPALWWVEDDWVDPSDEEVMFSNFNANLHVPASALEDYKFHPMYQDFKYIMAMGTVDVPVSDVVISPDKDNAKFTWPVVDKAVSYTLEITFEGELFCTLDFNAYGQLTGLNFKRSADVLPSTGFQFTVTGLENDTEYGYILEAKDSENKVLDTYTGTFTTGTSTAVEEASVASIKVSEGTISADADFSIYNTVGQDVTALNGALQSGIYVVAIGEDKVKVMVK